MSQLICVFVQKSMLMYLERLDVKMFVCVSQLLIFMEKIKNMTTLNEKRKNNIFAVSFIIYSDYMDNQT